MIHSMIHFIVWLNNVGSIELSFSILSNAQAINESYVMILRQKHENIKQQH